MIGHPIWNVSKPKILKTKKDYEEELKEYKKKYQEAKLELEEAEFNEDRMEKQKKRVEEECFKISEENKKIREQLKEATKKLNDKELESLSSDKEIERLKNKVSLLEEQLKDKNKLLEQYKALPDLNAMVKNLSTLTTPSLDKLVEVIEKTNSSDTTESLNGVKNKLEDLAREVRYTRYR